MRGHNYFNEKLTNEEIKEMHDTLFSEKGKIELKLLGLSIVWEVNPVIYVNHL